MIFLRYVFIISIVTRDSYIHSYNLIKLLTISHFIDVKEILKTQLLAICNILRDYNNKNQIKSIILVLEKYSLKKKLDYFILDNVSLNNTYMTIIFKTLYLDLD